MEEKAKEREEKEKKLAESKSESPDPKEEIVKQDRYMRNQGQQNIREYSL